MKAIYDLAFNPPTYDFVTALLTFECERIRRKEDSIDLEIWPGPVEGFRRDRLWPRSAAERRRLLAQIVLPMAAMLPSIRRVTFNDVRSDGFGAGRPLVKRRLLLDALAKGCRPLRQDGPTEPGLITFTLRECEHWPERNSHVPEWQCASDYLSELGYNVVIIRDDRITPISLIGRALLYRRAALNLFVNNGPAWFAMALDANVGILRPATEGIGHLYSRKSWYEDGVTDQIPGAPDYQRLIWCDDTRENIIGAVAHSSLAIDLAERTTRFWNSPGALRNDRLQRHSI